MDNPGSLSREEEKRPEDDLQWLADLLFLPGAARTPQSSSLASEFQDAHRDFRAALDTFRSLKQEDGGRAGVRMMLRAMYALIPESERELLEPFYLLCDALDELDHGHTHPLLAQKNVRGRRIDSRDVRNFKARCVVAAELLYQDALAPGRQPTRRPADDAVLRRVKRRAGELGVSLRLSSPRKPSIIDAWRWTDAKERRMYGEGHPQAALAEAIAGFSDQAKLRIRLSISTPRAEAERVLQPISDIRGEYAKSRC